MHFCFSYVAIRICFCKMTKSPSSPLVKMSYIFQKSFQGFLTSTIGRYENKKYTPILTLLY